MNVDDIWVVIPCYNEAQVISQTINEVLAHFKNVVVVNDASTDATEEILCTLPIVLVSHPVNLGQGAALQTGFEYALLRKARAVVTFDADGQHDPREALGMARLLISGPYDAVIGSRFLDAESIKAVPKSRRMLLRVATFFSNFGRKVKLTDAHNGLRALGETVLQNLQVSLNGMAHASEIQSILTDGRFNVVEFPTTIRYTDYSKAKGQKAVNSINILFDLFVKRVIGS